MDKEFEKSKDPELEVDPRSIAVVTTTFYPKWYPGVLEEKDIVDKIRGDLALEMINVAQKKGFQIVVIDGASNQEYKEELIKLGVIPSPETEKGMSGSRQQGFREASQLKGVKVICWAEPEKVSIVRDCLPQAIVPILNGEADIVIPHRGKNAFDTYPDYQVEFEQKANRIWNAILRKYKILPPTTPDLDVWFGPRFFRNDPNLLEIFLKKYEFNKDDLSKEGFNYHNIIRPELWPNAIFFPVVGALNKGYKVISVDMPYIHPLKQTSIEQDSVEFRRKREIQFKGIVLATEHLARTLTGNRLSRIREI